MTSRQPDQGFLRRVLRGIWPCVFSTVVIAVAVLAVYRIPTLSATPEGIVKVFGLLDQWHHYVQMATYMDGAIQSDEFPFWNPMTYCGMPFAANPQTYVFYPPNLLRSLLTSDPTPMNVHIGLVILLALHILLAGVSTFFLARDHKLGFGASTAAAFVFILSATFVRRVMAMDLIATVAWFPLIILLLRRAFLAESFRARMLYGIGCGTAFGMAVLSGFPQVILYMAFSVIGYGAIFRLLHIRRSDFRFWGGLPGLVFQDAVIGTTVFVVGGTSRGGYADSWNGIGVVE